MPANGRRGLIRHLKVNREYQNSIVFHASNTHRHLLVAAQMMESICGHQGAPVPAEDVVDSSPIHQEDLDHS